ncbi:FG-GAP repeat domain-containing protein [Streptomyces sp. NPDC050504]|uniref:FG-GAP repeat domain-containing protein n=1 Tax=Streptomyces sp. NPDC050504 TaxID=3365618 RepID=UPI0037887F4D
MTYFKRGRVLQRSLVTTAIAAALATTAGTAVAADQPGTGAQRSAAEAARTAGDVQRPAQAFKGAQAAPRVAAAAPGQTITNPVLYAAHKKNKYLYQYFANARGGLKTPAKLVKSPYDWATAVAHNDWDHDGLRDGTWNLHKNGQLIYASSGYAYTVATGWQNYTKVMSPGDLGGGAGGDFLAVDKAGVLWVYCGNLVGDVTPRVRVGTGWGQYTEIAGQGDLTGDGKTDVVTRDKQGNLWLHEGTGNYRAPFRPRKKVGAGWNAHNRILSIGDLTGDGKTDILARTKAGDLYRYSGTGRASAPLLKPVKIGAGFNAFNLL